MPNITITALLAALLAAPVASAQFTGVVAPPERPAPPVETVASTGAVTPDSTRAGRMADMRAWVDSAAVAISAQSPQDTVTPPVVIEQPAAPMEQAPAPEVSEFREGSPAPNTATPLPALVMLGLALVAGGAALRRR